MDANIWLSTADKNEALLLHDTGSSQLSGTEALIIEIRDLLGLANRDGRIIESKKVKPSSPKPLSSGIHSNSHATKVEAKVQTADSGSNTGGFIKGLGSRFKLR